MRGPSIVISAGSSPRNPERSRKLRLGLSAKARLAGITFVVCVAMNVSHAQTVTLLASFDGSNGKLPQASLVQGVSGDFYGTTPMGGATTAAGTVFKITPTGQLTTIYNFCSQPNCTDGWQPQSGLALGVNGNLYGTTSVGGIVGSCQLAGCGTVFEITPAGKLTTLYSFCPQTNCTDGASPMAGLVLASNGNFYGSTYYGGTNNAGTVFEITLAGKLTTLYSFCSEANCADGATPVAALVQASDGNLYGSTYDGGAIDCPFFHQPFGCGTIFEISLSGKLTTLYSFGTDAGLLQSPLVRAGNGNFYGTSQNGGTGPGQYGEGTVFEITAAGELTTLYSFCTQTNCPDGAYPMAGLALGTDGKLYGSTSTAGAGIGTLFSITPVGVFNTLYSFVNNGKGYNPRGALVQGTDGKFYGVDNTGGGENQGTIFSLSVGLSPFVETLPTSGTVGAKVIILGNNLTDTTAVSFNGTAARFTVSNAEIEATVPNGATTGSVVVATPAQSLKSNTVFRVEP